MAQTGWLAPEQFTVGVGLAYATPGPVLLLVGAVAVGAITAAFSDVLPG